MFDWNECYKGDASDYQEPDMPTLVLVEELRPGRALDVGCGAGGLVVGLAELGWAVTGIDMADTAVAAARAVTASRGIEARLETADATTWKPPARYDLVISTFALPVTKEERAAVFKMIRNAVAPGGTVVLKEYDAAMQSVDVFAEYDLPTVEELREAFAGFELKKAAIVDGPSFGSEKSTAALLVARNEGSAD